MTSSEAAESAAGLSEPANSPGLILKRCREFHQISLDEASDSTKIGKNYLRALENDRVVDFANIAYLKGFVRIYATFLGLNPDDMIRMYEKLYGDPAARQPESASSEEAVPKKAINWQRLMVPAVLLSAIIALAIVMSGKRIHPPRQTPVSPVMTRQSASAVAAAPVMPRRSAVSQPPADKAQEPEKPPEKPSQPQTATEPEVIPADGFILRMKAVKDGSLQIMLDESISHDYILTSGDVIEWKAVKIISLDISDISSIELELNGRPFKTGGQAGKHTYINVGPKGLVQ